MHGGEERTVKLKEKLPVYLGYWTVSIGPDGIVQFRKDVYGIDGQQTARLSDRLKRLRKAMTSASASIATPASSSSRAASR